MVSTITHKLESSHNSRVSHLSLWGGNHGRAIGAAVIMFALTLLMIDHTSENNAQMYQAEIIKALEE